MQHNAFELLGIEPTNDYKKVMIALIKKDKEYYDTHKDNQEIDIPNPLDKIFEEIQSPSQLLNYFAKIENNNFLNKNTNKKQTRIINEKDRCHVFIPVSIGFSRDEFKLEHNILMKEEFIANFDYKKLAETLNNMSQRKMLMVGTTDEEAVDIANLHRHCNFKLIVHINISRDYLIDEPMLEGAIAPNLLSANNEKAYQWILRYSSFKIEDIVSVRCMQWGTSDYYNSAAIDDPFIDALWPRELTETLINPVIKDNKVTDISEIDLFQRKLLISQQGLWAKETSEPNRESIDNQKGVALKS